MASYCRISILKLPYPRLQKLCLKKSAKKRPTNTEWLYLKLPYISKRLNYRITNIFRKKKHPTTYCPQITHPRALSLSLSFIRDCIREHLNNKNSFLKKHISLCQNKGYKGIEIKTIVYENDPANLHLFEAFYIRKWKPALNSRDECSDSRTFCFNFVLMIVLMIALILSWYISRDALFYETYLLDLFIHNFIYISTRNIYFIPEDAVDRRKLRF